MGLVSDCKPCLAGYYCPGVVSSPANQLIQCQMGTYLETPSATNAGQCQQCPVDFYCAYTSGKSGCPTGTGSNASSVSQLQCICNPGWACSYTHFVQSMVTLYMTPAQFATPAVRQAFIASVAAAAGTATTNVKIISYRDTATGQVTTVGRRLLRAEAGFAGSSHDSEDTPLTHVFLSVEHATTLRDLDLHLFAHGIEPSHDHVVYAPHAVVATPTQNI
jgi:hypothetical protein